MSSVLNFKLKSSGGSWRVGSVLAHIGLNDTGHLGGRGVDQLGDLRTRRHEQAHDSGAQLVERWQSRKRLDRIRIKRGGAHRPAQDHELLVRLGKIDGGLGSRDRVAGKRHQGRALEQRRDGSDVAAFESDFGQPVFRHPHARTRLLHLPAKRLHLDDGQAGIMRDHDNVGGFEHRAKVADHFAFCRTIQTLSPVGGLARAGVDALHPAPRDPVMHRRGPSRSEPRTKPRPSPVYAGLAIKPLRAPAVSDRKRSNNSGQTIPSPTKSKLDRREEKILTWCLWNAQERAGKPVGTPFRRLSSGFRRSCQVRNVAASFRRQASMTDTQNYFIDGEAYERLMGRFTRAAGQVFVDWLSPPKGLDWIDVGCGTGAFTELVLDRCAPGKVSAVDPSAEQIAYARKTPAAKRADFQIGDAQSLRFDDAAFDAGVMALVITFVPDPTKALAELRRVTKPGGMV